jgi:hypothetical protein
MAVAVLVPMQSVDSSSPVVSLKHLPPLSTASESMATLAIFKEGAADGSRSSPVPVHTTLVQKDVEKASPLKPSSVNIRGGRRDLALRDDPDFSAIIYSTIAYDKPYWTFTGEGSLNDPDEDVWEHWSVEEPLIDPEDLDNQALDASSGGSTIPDSGHSDDLPSAVNPNNGHEDDDDDGNDRFQINDIEDDDKVPAYEKGWMDRTQIGEGEEDNNEYVSTDGNATAHSQSLNGNITKIEGIGSGTWNVASSSAVASLTGTVVLAWFLASTGSIL